ncbi:MAG: S24/S26 family peptidase [Candidatus Onthomonas sp.]
METGKNLRIIDAQVYIPLLQSIMAEGKVVPLIITGSSMTPFLAPRRDRVFLKQAEGPLKRGDMAFFRRPNGQYVFHRIWKVQGDQYYFLGDAQTEIEGPVPRNAIFAVAVQAERKGKTLTPDAFWWKFFRDIWPLLRPVRRPICRLYAALTAHRRGRTTPNTEEVPHE